MWVVSMTPFWSGGRRYLLFEGCLLFEHLWKDSMNKGSKCVNYKMCSFVSHPWGIVSQQQLRIIVCITPNTYYFLLGVVNSKTKRDQTGIVNELIELGANNREWRALWWKWIQGSLPPPPAPPSKGIHVNTLKKYSGCQIKLWSLFTPSQRWMQLFPYTFVFVGSL